MKMINLHELTGQESGIMIENEVLVVINWAIGGEEISGKIIDHGQSDDTKSMLDYTDVIDDNNDLKIISTKTPCSWWEIEGENGTIMVIAPEGWN